MPAHSDDGLTEKSIDVLFRAALEVVADNFNAAEHLPKPVYDFLLPVATSSCQGLYATAMLFLGSMPALANGASVRLWTQKPSPLALMVLHMAPAQRGKSRLYQAVELLFEAADDVVEDLAKVEAHKVGQSLAVEGVAGQPPADVPVQTKSICLQSFTMTEFFYRCSAEFPQVELHQGATKKEKAAKRLWFGQAFNLDEAYEFLENLSLLGSRSEKAKDSSVNAHASTLNTLLARGKTKRATRTSTSFEASRTQHVSLSVLGNGHPTKLVRMERNLEGQHTAATKERFLLCVDASVPRHESLSPDMLAADTSLQALTWLPLTPLQAAIFGWSGLLNNPAHFEAQDSGEEEGFPAELPDGVQSRVRYIYPDQPSGFSAAQSCAWPNSISSPSLLLACAAWPACWPSEATLTFIAFLLSGCTVPVRTEWRISGRWRAQDPTAHIQAGARRVCDYFATRPHSVLELTAGAQTLLLGILAAGSVCCFLLGVASFSCAWPNSITSPSLFACAAWPACWPPLSFPCPVWYAWYASLQATKSPSPSALLGKMAKLPWRPCTPMRRTSKVY